VLSKPVEDPASSSVQTEYFKLDPITIGPPVQSSAPALSLLTSLGGLIDNLCNDVLTSMPMAVQLRHYAATSEQERRMRGGNQHYE